MGLPLLSVLFPECALGTPPKVTGTSQNQDSPREGGQSTDHLSTARQEKFLESRCRFIDAYLSQDQHLADWCGPAEVIPFICPLQGSLSLSSPAVLKAVWPPPRNNRSSAVLCTKLRKSRMAAAISPTVGSPTDIQKAGTTILYVPGPDISIPKPALWQP